ncbi:unnamed protein product [Cercopithifilaria johnstoni]|uniref:Uncharacterized protein n=1 Tax=Cercopithifilaria johnstoni TaxID=2874296 RepID=A0A8J2MCP3_9BILA|nr:unnamed protein product [Cercopithifilaria johnstoni]
MKILLQFLVMLRICFLVTTIHILNLDNTLSDDNEMPTNYYGASFINTDGIQKFCSSNIDCYSMREPTFWCRLAENQQWTEKGCYCDPILKACIIERITKLGPVSKIHNYAYCISQIFWQCSPYQII